MTDNNLESLMRDVARTVQADARRRQLLPEVQARLAALDEQSRQPRGAWRLTLLGAAACAAGIAIFVLRPQPLSYAVDTAGVGGPRAGAVGERLVASDATPMALQFSDGSQVTLPPRAQAHVDALDEHGATVALEEGAVEVSVVHRAHTHWEIRAGRYHIRVTGTRFQAGWDRRKDMLTVKMREGSVEVTGPGLKAPARVVTGQWLRANGAAADRAAGETDEPAVVVEDGTIAAAREAGTEAHAAPVPDTAAADEAPAAGETAQAEVETAPAHAAPVVGKPAAAPAREVDRRAPRVRHQAKPVTVADNEWRALEAQHQFKAAFAAAQEGWDGKCQRLGAEDLVKLGNLARYAGKFAYAEEAYQAARRRFPSAEEPVYYLGLVAFDGHRNYAAAARLFDEYLHRFPHGALVCEATGRLLESRLNAGDNDGARDAAASYLRSCPHGSHAGMARATVGH